MADAPYCAGCERLLAANTRLRAAGDEMAAAIERIGLVSCSDDCDHSMCVAARGASAWRALADCSEGDE